MVVSAGQGLRHPSCFSCTVCQQFLSKLIYYSDDNNRLYCGRHYAELFKPRCFDCDEVYIHIYRRSFILYYTTRSRTIYVKNSVRNLVAQVD